MTMRETVLATLAQIMAERDLALSGPISDEMVLLESGLDSLGFAVLVATLEDKFGYDPFVLMTAPVYPRTLKEFVSIYDQFQR